MVFYACFQQRFEEIDVESIKNLANLQRWLGFLLGNAESGKHAGRWECKKKEEYV